jgi:hypothetical protein
VTNPINLTPRQFKRIQKNLDTPADPAADKQKSVSKLMTMFLKDWEEITGERLTTATMQSPQWREMRKQFVFLFMPLMKGRKK